MSEGNPMICIGNVRTGTRAGALPKLGLGLGSEFRKALRDVRLTARERIATQAKAGIRTGAEAARAAIEEAIPLPESMQMAEEARLAASAPVPGGEPVDLPPVEALPAVAPIRGSPEHLEALEALEGLLDALGGLDDPNPVAVAYVEGLAMRLGLVGSADFEANGLAGVGTRSADGGFDVYDTLRGVGHADGSGDDDEGGFLGIGKRRRTEQAAPPPEPREQAAPQPRVVKGRGGWVYTQRPDGSIVILTDPRPGSPAQGHEVHRGSGAWAAITKEIGPYPSSATVVARTDAEGPQIGRLMRIGRI